MPTKFIRVVAALYWDLNTVFECESCILGFHKKNSLQNHMTISHRKDITVVIALKKFTQRFLCRVTWLSSTGMISVQQVWLQSSRKSSPEETHNCLSQGWYQCSSCDYKVHVRAPLRRHTIVSHMGKYKCSDCVLKLRQKPPLRRHTIIFHRDDIRATSVTTKFMRELL